MRLLHYSAKPFVLDRGWTQPVPPMKPSGLWVSVEGPDDWPSWCRSEGYHLEGLACVSEVRLVQPNSVLVLDTAASLDAFNERFRRTPDDSNFYNIYWPDVQALYSGLIIAPYQWERRHSPFWYYTWDCASGVLWDLSAIAEVLPLDHEVHNRNRDEEDDKRCEHDG